MSHMQTQVRYGSWLRVDTREGTDFIEADSLYRILQSLGVEEGVVYDVDSPQWDHVLPRIREFFMDDPYSVELVDGWGARMSAPGYMDCTDWCVFPTKEEAEEYLKDYYL